MNYTAWFVLKQLGINPEVAAQIAMQKVKSAATANQQTAAGFQQPVSQLAPNPSAPPGQPKQESPMTASPPNPFFQKLIEIIHKHRQKVTSTQGQTGGKPNG